MDDLIEGLRAGERVAVKRFCETYSAPLERLARRYMAPALQQRLGPDDVVQSVYRTFFRRAGEGQFALEDSSELWRLLSAIALTKVREKARYHFRQKRGLDREVPADAERGPVLATAAPSAEEAAAFTQLFERLLEDLDDEEKRVVELKLADRGQAEIAADLGCSERTVRRILVRLKARFEAALA